MTYRTPRTWSEDEALICPVPEGVLAAIHRATPAEAASIARLLPDAQRSQLALFCFARTHLRAAGCAIATACSDHELVRQGGIAGQALIMQRAIPEVGRKASHGRAITLSTAAKQHLFVTQDEDDVLEPIENVA